MATLTHLLLLLTCILSLHLSATSAQILTSSSAASAAAMAVYQGGDMRDLALDMTLDDLIDDDSDGVGMSSSSITTTDGRRSLYWHRAYYISYGALSANRVPCPPRSGRSYYTHNCYHARGPVHPYSRGCSCISRCRR